MLARTVHWFNPLVWLLVRRAGEDIELACDQAVVQGLDFSQKKAYGTAILNSAASQLTTGQALTTCFTKSGGSLKARLVNLFDTHNKKKGALLLATCVLAVAVIGSCWAFAAPGAAPAVSWDLRPDGLYVADDGGALLPLPLPDGVTAALLADPTQAATTVYADAEKVLLFWCRQDTGEAAGRYTTDRGQTWHGITLSTKGDGIPPFHQAWLDFPAGSDGCLVLAAATADGQELHYLYHSSDQGRTWQETGNPNDLCQQPLTATAWADAQRGLLLFAPAAGELPPLYGTDDAGATWQALELGINAQAEESYQPYNVQLWDRQGLLTLERRADGADAGTLFFLSTDDGGAHWSPLTSDSGGQCLTAAIREVATAWAQANQAQDGPARAALMNQEEQLAYEKRRQEALNTGATVADSWQVDFNHQLLSGFRVDEQPEQLQATITYRVMASDGQEQRSTETLTLAWQDGQLKVAAFLVWGWDRVYDGDVFQRLYGAPLGLPAAPGDKSSLTEPVAAATTWLHLASGQGAVTTAGEEECQVTYTFANGQTLLLTLARHTGDEASFYWQPYAWRLTAPPVQDSTTTALQTAAELWAQGVRQRDGHLLYALLNSAAQETFLREISKDSGEPDWLLSPSSPYVDRTAVHLDSEQRRAYIVYAWDTSAGFDSRSVDTIELDAAGQISDFRRNDNRLGDHGENGLATFALLYGEPLGLPREDEGLLQLLTAPAPESPHFDAYVAQLQQPDTAAREILQLAEGEMAVVSQEGASAQLLYTFPNGQSLLLNAEAVGQTDLEQPIWVPRSWQPQQTAIQRPDDATAQAQIIDVYERWTEGMHTENGQIWYDELMTPALAARFYQKLLESGLTESDPGFWNAYHDGDLITGAQIEIDLQQDAAHLHYTLRHTLRDEAWLDLTLYFTWQEGRALVKDVEVSEYYGTDPQARVTDLDTLLANGLPTLKQPEKNFLTRPHSGIGCSDPSDAARFALGLFGGSSQLIEENGSTATVRYTFANGQAADIHMELVQRGSAGSELADIWFPTALEEANTTPTFTEAGEIGRRAAANEWALGVALKNGRCRYTVLSQEAKKAFLQEQFDLYGLQWFWRIGWGSSPTPYQWVILDCDEHQATLVYSLYDSGYNGYRYAEQVYFGQEEGQVVITGSQEISDNLSSALMTYEQFKLLYANALPQPRYEGNALTYFQENERERYQAYLTPVGAVEQIYGFAGATWELRQQTADTAVVAGIFSPGQTILVSLNHPEGFSQVWMPFQVEVP